MAGLDHVHARRLEHAELMRRPDDVRLHLRPEIDVDPAVAAPTARADVETDRFAGGWQGDARSRGVSPVERLEIDDVPGDVVVLARVGHARRPYFLAAHVAGLDHHAQDGLEVWLAVRRYDEAAAGRFDHFGDAADARRDDRQSGGHGLDDRDRLIVRAAG